MQTQSYQDSLQQALSKRTKVYHTTFIIYYGELRAELKRSGALIGNNDLLIASHAISAEAILVTNNTSEIKRVPHLIIEDWSAF
jgi:predicted nucleic acid-binding protein